jgi:hypothetical protein
MTTFTGGRRAPATIEEIGDRVRRIETRFTSYLASIGFETRTQRSVWDKDGNISIPSMDCSIKDILAAVPADFVPDENDIGVYHKGKHVMCFYTIT